MVKNRLANEGNMRHGFDTWVRKIPWRRDWQPTAVSLPGNSMDRGSWWAIVHRVAKSKTGLSSHTRNISYYLVQFSSVTQSCSALSDPMNCSMPGFPVHHQLLELAQIHVHRVGDAIQPSNPLSSPSPPAFSLSQHQGLF